MDDSLRMSDQARTMNTQAINDNAVKIVAESVRIFGVKPDVVAQAPGRVNLIGEHIDYSDGFVLPFAIRDVTTVGIAKRKDQVIRVVSHQKADEIYQTSVSELIPQSLEGSSSWASYVLGVLWSLGIHEGVDIVVDGAVPLGAGLSSSAALECAVAVGLNALFGLNLTLKDLARATQKAENDFVGMPCGIMDQSVSLMAKEGFALLLDCRDLSTEDIPFDIAPHGLELLIIDTQAHHALVDGGYAERRASCELAVATLGIPSLRDISISDYSARKSELDEKTFIRGLHAVTEMKRVLDTVSALKSNDFTVVGKLLNESHRSLRDDYTVSCPELNLAVDTSLACGALGARMVGGGFGGSAIALIASDQVAACKQELEVAFAAAGFLTPRFFTSTPSQGAQVIQYF